MLIQTDSSDLDDVDFAQNEFQNYNVESEDKFKVSVEMG